MIFSKWAREISKILLILGSYNFLAYLECVRSYAWSKGHSDPDLGSVITISNTMLELTSLGILLDHVGLTLLLNHHCCNLLQTTSSKFSTFQSLPDCINWSMCFSSDLFSFDWLEPAAAHGRLWWHFCAQVLSWLELQLKNSPWLFHVLNLDWNQKQSLLWIFISLAPTPNLTNPEFQFPQFKVL